VWTADSSEDRDPSLIDGFIIAYLPLRVCTDQVMTTVAVRDLGGIFIDVYLSVKTHVTKTVTTSTGSEVSILPLMIGSSVVHSVWYHQTGLRQLHFTRRPVIPTQLAPATAARPGVLLFSLSKFQFDHIIL